MRRNKDNIYGSTMNANCAVAFLNSMIYEKKYALLSDEYIYK